MKQRLYYIDNLKGILILLVILGHCIQFTTDDFDHNPIFRFIYSFHMPLFMAVSGYVSYKAELKWEALGRRFMQLVVPFLAWLVLATVRIGDPRHFFNVLLQPDNGLWFLWVLFAIVVLLTACQRLAGRMRSQAEWMVGAFAVVMLGCIVVFKLKLFGAHLIAWYFIYYCMGFFLRKYESIGFSMPIVATAVFILAFAILVPFWMRKEPPTFLHIAAGSSVGMMANYMFNFIVATSAILALIPLSRILLNRNTLIINKLGGVTLGLYAIHQPLIGLVTAGAATLEIMIGKNPLFIAALFVVTTVISCFIYYLLNKWHITAMLFLGKTRKKV